MRYTKYTIHTTTEAEELVSAMLAELGITGIEIDNLVPVLDGDRQGGVFEELQPDLSEDDGKSHVSFYAEENEDVTALLQQIEDELSQMCAYTNIGDGNITCDISDEADWRDNWKQYFSSFSIGNILIKPTWEEAPADLQEQILVEIDPGVSFGTGKHESTQLVIKQLQKYLKPDQEILDVGCGSGILSIIALKMGAGHVVGTDIDEDCIASSYENFDVNHLPHDLGDFYVGNLIDDEQLQQRVGTETYDLVLANILADIIIPMAPALANAMKPGAYVITSGIIDFKEQEVADALTAAGLVIQETNAQGEWRNITAKKPI
ncbi:MAG: 50S ribosomal protein L11 methyltransferase [Lachnospiraceae bacterium]|nr:50S ribosomal protein L11 methyltransferase [Lachnospiraceae bacterium]